MSLYLHGLGHFHPEVEITNRFLEDLDIGTSDAWIMERVGIRSRRTVLPLDYIRETRNRDPRLVREAIDRIARGSFRYKNNRIPCLRTLKARARKFLSRSR